MSPKKQEELLRAIKNVLEEALSKEKNDMQNILENMTTIPQEVKKGIYNDYEGASEAKLQSITEALSKSLVKLSRTIMPVTGTITVTPEDVKAGLYSDFEVARKTTGYFRMSKHDEFLRLEIQLKENTSPTGELRKRFYQAIRKHVNTYFELLVYPYREFPYGMGLIYEHKFKYV